MIDAVSALVDDESTPKERHREVQNCAVIRFSQTRIRPQGVI